MLQRAALTVLAAGLVSGLLCQAQPAASPSIPDWVLYESFFHHVAFVEQSAQKVDAKGKSGDSGRLIFANTLGLTRSQMSVLNPIAADCLANLAPIYSAAAHGAGGPAQQSRREQVIADHVQQLKAAFGTGFAALDARIRAISRLKAYPAPSAKSRSQED